MLITQADAPSTPTKKTCVAVLSPRSVEKFPETFPKEAETLASASVAEAPAIESSHLNYFKVPDAPMKRGKGVTVTWHETV